MNIPGTRRRRACLSRHTWTPAESLTSSSTLRATIAAKQYAGTLPYGLRFDMTRDQMSQAVGSPGADNGEGLVWELPDFDLFAGENPKTNKLESFCVSGTF